MTINLSQYIGKLCKVEFRDPDEWPAVIAEIKFISDIGDYPFEVNGNIFTESGNYYADGENGSDIVSIKELTVIEWIDDRLPSKKDACNDKVQVISMYTPGCIAFTEWKNVAPGRKWARCPGWTPPEAPVDPREERINQLERQLEELKQQLRDIR